MQTVRRFIQYSSLILVAVLGLSVQHAVADDDVVMAPNFELKDAKGTLYTLESFKGKPLILHFWGTWCPYCKRVQPGIDALGKKYVKDGLQVIGASFNEPPNAKPQMHLTQHGITFKTLLNGELTAMFYEIRGTPTTYFIDRKGELIWGTNTINPNDPKLDIYAKKIIARQ